MGYCNINQTLQMCGDTKTVRSKCMLRLQLFCKRQGDSARMYVFPGRCLYKAGRGRHQMFLEKRHHVLIAQKRLVVPRRVQQARLRTCCS